MTKSIKNIFAVNNTVNFSPRSCGAASSSTAKRTDVNVNEIFRRGCCKKWKSFFKYYDKEVTEYATGDIEFNRICRVCNV